MQEENESEFGDFEEIKEESPKDKKPQHNNEQEVITRIRTPREGQFIGIVLQRLGGNRMSVKTTDEKIRNCRVPGRYSRKFWIRPGNYVIIEPWPDNDEKGDVVYLYRKNENYQLKKKKLVENLKEEF